MGKPAEEAPKDETPAASEPTTIPSQEETKKEEAP